MFSHDDMFSNAYAVDFMEGKKVIIHYGDRTAQLFRRYVEKENLSVDVDLMGKVLTNKFVMLDVDDSGQDNTYCLSELDYLCHLDKHLGIISEGRSKGNWLKTHEPDVYQLFQKSFYGEETILSMTNGFGEIIHSRRKSWLDDKQHLLSLYDRGKVLSHCELRAVSEGYGVIDYLTLDKVITGICLYSDFISTDKEKFVRLKMYETDMAVLLYKYRLEEMKQEIEKGTDLSCVGMTGYLFRKYGIVTGDMNGLTLYVLSVVYNRLADGEVITYR